MSVFKDILNEEYSRLKQLADSYRKELDALPKGSLSVKSIRGRSYCYRAYREKNKVKFEYLGRADSPRAEEMKEKLHRRKELLARLRQTRTDLREMSKVVDGPD